MKIFDKLIEKMEAYNRPIDTEYKFSNSFDVKRYFGYISVFKSGYDFFLIDKKNNIEYESKHQPFRTGHTHNFCIYKNKTEKIGYTFRYGDNVEDDHEGCNFAWCHVKGYMDNGTEFSMKHIYIYPANTIAPPNVLHVMTKHTEYTLVYNTKISTSTSYWPMMVYKENTPLFRVIESKNRNRDNFTLEYSSIEQLDEIMIVLFMMFNYLYYD